MSDDYAGADYSEAESELGRFEDEMEVSGYDAVTTTQAGMRMDDFLKESGMTIDTVGEARKAQEHSKKENEKAADAREAIREVFSRAHEHVDNHKYNLNLDGKDYEISHGELKDFMKKQSEQFAKRAKTEKDSKKRAQMEQDSQILMRLYQHMSTQGPLNEDQLKEFSDVLDRNPEMKVEFENRATLTDQRDEFKKMLSENPSMNEEFQVFSKPVPTKPQIMDCDDIEMDCNLPEITMSGDSGSTLVAANEAQQTIPQKVDLTSNSQMEMNVNF